MRARRSWSTGCSAAISKLRSTADRANHRMSALHSMPLFREQMMIVLHPDHPLAKRNAVMPKDLTGERYLNRANCEFYGYAGRDLA